MPAERLGGEGQATDVDYDDTGTNTSNNIIDTSDTHPQNDQPVASAATPPVSEDDPDWTPDQADASPGTPTPPHTDPGSLSESTDELEIALGIRHWSDAEDDTIRDPGVSVHLPLPPTLDVTSELNIGRARKPSPSILMLQECEGLIFLLNRSR